jgi:hypothetical protein
LLASYCRKCSSGSKSILCAHLCVCIPAPPPSSKSTACCCFLFFGSALVGQEGANFSHPRARGPHPRVPNPGQGPAPRQQCVRGGRSPGAPGARCVIDCGATPHMLGSLCAQRSNPGVSCVLNLCTCLSVCPPSLAHVLCRVPPPQLPLRSPRIAAPMYFRCSTTYTHSAPCTRLCAGTAASGAEHSKPI